MVEEVRTTTETWLDAPRAVDGVDVTGMGEEPNVGSIEFDDMVVASSQQLPAHMQVTPPEIMGQDRSVVAAYLAMYIDGSLPYETLEEIWTCHVEAVSCQAAGLGGTV